MSRADWERRIACKVRHVLPGRVRLACPAVTALAGYERDIEGRLCELPAVRSAQVSKLAGSLLVHYDSAAISPEHIRRAAQAVVATYAPTLAKGRWRRDDAAQERQVQAESAEGQIRRLVGASLGLLYTWLRRPPAVAVGLLGRLLAPPAVAALALSGPIFRSGLRALRTDLRPNADTLTASAILAAVFTGQGGSALAIIWLIDLAELLTATTIRRTRGAIQDMLAVGQKRVRRLRPDGSEEQVPLERLRTGDRILVLTGEKISVDGLVEAGEAAVDQASLTGEFLPAYKAVGETVFAGTLVQGGRLTVRAEKVGDETAIARLVRLVEEASARQARVQGLADHLSARLIPLHFGLALLVWLGTRSPVRALSLLVIDYSCSLRLSTATALSATVYTAARHGVLIKGGHIVEELVRADTLLLDKTGTVTAGRARVDDVLPMQAGVNPVELICTAAAAEEGLPHPLAAGIVEKARELRGTIPQHTDSRVYLGRGVVTRVDGALVRVGSRQFMVENGVSVRAASSAAHRLAQSGAAVVYVARDREMLGLLAVRDPLRHHVREAVRRLRRLGVQTVHLLTGDAVDQARAVATQIQADHFQAGLLPEDKIRTVLQLQGEGRRVLMVGDGSNDAPALAYADVGVAMGARRTDVAMEAADVVLAGDDPRLLPEIVRLGQRMTRTVRQNFALALGVNSLGMALGAGGLLPLFWCAVLHNATTLAVVFNSARLLFHDLEREP